MEVNDLLDSDVHSLNDKVIFSSQIESSSKHNNVLINEDESFEADEVCSSEDHVSSEPQASTLAIEAHQQETSAESIPPSDIVASITPVQEATSSHLDNLPFKEIAIIEGVWSSVEDVEGKSTNLNSNENGDFVEHNCSEVSVQPSAITFTPSDDTLLSNDDSSKMLMINNQQPVSAVEMELVVDKSSTSDNSNDECGKLSSYNTELTREADATSSGKTDTKLQRLPDIRNNVFFDASTDQVDPNELLALAAELMQTDGVQTMQERGVFAINTNLSNSVANEDAGGMFLLNTRDDASTTNIENSDNSVAEAKVVSTLSETPMEEEPVPKKRRGRKPSIKALESNWNSPKVVKRQKTPSKSVSSLEAEEEEGECWVRCDKCEKWRKLEFPWDKRRFQCPQLGISCEENCDCDPPCACRNTISPFAQIEQAMNAAAQNITTQSPTDIPQTPHMNESIEGMNDAQTITTPINKSEIKQPKPRKPRIPKSERAVTGATTTNTSTTTTTTTAATTKIPPSPNTVRNAKEKVDKKISQEKPKSDNMELSDSYSSSTSNSDSDSESDWSDDEALYCCGERYNKEDDYVGCSSYGDCKGFEWYHLECVKLTRRQALNMGEWFCQACLRQMTPEEFAQTKKKRKGEKEESDASFSDDNEAERRRRKRKEAAQDKQSESSDDEEEKPLSEQLNDHKVAQAKKAKRKSKDDIPLLSLVQAIKAPSKASLHPDKYTVHPSLKKALSSATPRSKPKPAQSSKPSTKSTTTTITAANTTTTTTTTTAVETTTTTAASTSTTSSKIAKPSDFSNYRIKAREALQEILGETLAQAIDDSVWQTLKVEQAYKLQMRELVQNLRDPRNPELKERILNGDLKVEQLSTATASDLASASVAVERSKAVEDALQMAFKPDSVRAFIAERVQQTKDAIEETLFPSFPVPEQHVQSFERKVGFLNRKLSAPSSTIPAPQQPVVPLVEPQAVQSFAEFADDDVVEVLRTTTQEVDSKDSEQSTVAITSHDGKEKESNNSVSSEGSNGSISAKNVTKEGGDEVEDEEWFRRQNQARKHSRSRISLKQKSRHEKKRGEVRLRTKEHKHKKHRKRKDGERKLPNPDYITWLDESNKTKTVASTESDSEPAGKKGRLQDGAAKPADVLADVADGDIEVVVASSSVKPPAVSAVRMSSRDPRLHRSSSATATPEPVKTSASTTSSAITSSSSATTTSSAPPVSSPSSSSAVSSLAKRVAFPKPALPSPKPALPSPKPALPSPKPALPSPKPALPSPKSSSLSKPATSRVAKSSSLSKPATTPTAKPSSLSKPTVPAAKPSSKQLVASISKSKSSSPKSPVSVTPSSPPPLISLPAFLPPLPSLPPASIPLPTSSSVLRSSPSDPRLAQRVSFNVTSTLQEDPRLSRPSLSLPPSFSTSSSLASACPPSSAPTSSLQTGLLSRSLNLPSDALLESNKPPPCHLPPKSIQQPTSPLVSNSCPRASTSQNASTISERSPVALSQKSFSDLDQTVCCDGREDSIHPSGAARSEVSLSTDLSPSSQLLQSSHSFKSKSSCEVPLSHTAPSQSRPASRLSRSSFSCRSSLSRSKESSSSRSSRLSQSRIREKRISPRPLRSSMTANVDEVFSSHSSRPVQSTYPVEPPRPCPPLPPQLPASHQQSFLLPQQRYRQQSPPPQQSHFQSSSNYQHPIRPQQQSRYHTHTQGRLTHSEQPPELPMPPQWLPPIGVIRSSAPYLRPRDHKLPPFDFEQREFAKYQSISRMHQGHHTKLEHPKAKLIQSRSRSRVLEARKVSKGTSLGHERLDSALAAPRFN